MRQVPRYLIIGNGRLARHMSHYFQLKNIPHQQWFREHSQPLDSLLTFPQTVLLLISDRAIEPFIEANPSLLNHTLIHCSGALFTPKAQGVHPLMTFGPHLYSIEVYESLCFVLDQGGTEFKTLFPELNHRHCYLSPEQKALYHSWCVMGGNFTCLLWNQLFIAFEEKLGLPKEIAFPYLKQVTENLQRNPENALTGPLVRSDQKTLNANLRALEGDPYQQVYRAFVHAFNESKKREETV